MTHASETPWLFAVLLPLVIAVVLADLADGGLDAKGIVHTVFEALGKDVRAETVKLA